MTQNGCDYSRGGFPSSAALKEAGMAFVVRYVVGDLSPGGRGITAAEYAELTAGGIETCAVWEGAENRITAGFQAGAMDARDAQMHLIAAGMPERMPIYFACDFQATGDDQSAIDDYLRGCASILGPERVGIYGGFYVVARCHANNSAAWFWQTRAWSYNDAGQFQFLQGAHMLQYPTNADVNGVRINGVDCDADAAYQDNYGQASKFLVIEPTFPKPEFPPEYRKSLGKQNRSQFNDDAGRRWVPEAANVKALKETYSYVKPDTKSDHSGPPIEKDAKIGVDWLFKDGDGRKWIVNPSGYMAASGFTPDLQFPEAR